MQQRKHYCTINQFFPLPFYYLFVIFLPALACGQHEHEKAQNNNNAALPIIENVEPQPLISQALRIDQALQFLGSSLNKEDRDRLMELKKKKPGAEVVKEIQQILDPYCLAGVNINPEARVMVTRGPARPVLIQGGWTSFLVKIHNESGATSQLEVESANAAPMFHGSQNGAHAKASNHLDSGDVANRFLEIGMYRNRPLEPKLSGLKLEYGIIQLYSRDRGQREVNLGFSIGQGTKDLAFRNAMSVLFAIMPSVTVEFAIKNDDGKPAMGSFIITDSIQRLQTNNYRLTLAQNEFGVLSKRLVGIYPLPSRRMAETDEYPDFYFQPQVYRYDGEHVSLSPGSYQVNFTRGPEYISQTIGLQVPKGVSKIQQSFRLKRWINMASLGWYSADHHIHAAGCSHYESPEEGVAPPAMFRQSLGEGLDMSTVLSWGPGWYNQKKYFMGKLSSLSTAGNLMRYDVEVSGFPSSHAGHIVLLDLDEDDYPGTSTIEQWPSWTQPVLTWAQSQGGITGYAHSGWGLEPITLTTELPNYILPKMDGIGANEYVVTVTQGKVDFFSAGDTPAPWELNMWYHTLNSGFRTRLSGETDFPCIFDERVGLARSYFKTGNGLSYEGYINSIKAGRSYVSDGRSHIIDFSVNGIEMGVGNSELKLAGGGNIKVTAKATAYLSEKQDEAAEAIAGRPLTEPPYWNTERARIKTSRKISVELIVNGEAKAKSEINADGKWSDLNFNYQLQRSAWIALRIYPAAHTNPVFVIVDNKPIQVKKSAEWCRLAVDQCWKTKEPNIRKEEKQAAESAYKIAGTIYDGIIKSSNQ
ncbi:CehA/McbA family metallohydrolase [Flavitalea sp.]|nr:CehA/McbA family metallohydrolase [Flavitalea sp.]